MNHSVTESIPRKTSSGSLRDPWLKIFRALWIIVAVGGISLYIAAIPVRLREINPDCQTQPCSAIEQAEADAIRDAGHPGTFVAWYFVVVDSLTCAIFIAVAALIFWRRSDDQVAMFASFMLLAIGLTFGPEISMLVALTPVLLPVPILLQFLGWGSGVVFFFIFPDGKFVPRWTRWVSPIWYLVLVFFSTSTASDVYGNPIAFFLLIVGGVFALIAQVFRYRHVSTPAQRQQTKWIMLGLAAMIALFSIGILPAFINPALLRTGVNYRMIRVLLSGALPASLMPIALALSMLRYRLWDVDFIINRALVYGAVMLLLGGIFVGGVFALRVLLGSVLGSGQDLIAIASPAAAITALFNPTQKALRRFVDKRLYGIKLDYLAALKVYGRSKQEPIRQGGDTPTTFGSYSRLLLVGRGGMGEVYRAQHPTLNRSVAIKIVSALASASPEAHKRFLREAQTIAKLKHPNIITLHDMGEQDGKPYMVMEYIDGQDLAAILKERERMPLAEAVPILQDIADALDYAHAQGVIHRDIKPSNVMLEKVTATGTGKTQRAVLMDFGIAKSYTAGTNLTQSGMIGTLDYISPEQIQGASEVDARADIYSLGVMAYQMFAGKLPFPHNNPGALVMAHLMQPPPDPREVVSDLAETSAKAIMRAMAKQPEDRFSTAGEFVAALVG